MSSKRLWFLVLILGGAFALRVFGLDFQSLWRDETDALAYATQDLGGFLQQYRGAGQNGPLYLLMLRGWVAVAGQSEFGLRYFPLLWSMVTVALFYRLGSYLLGWRAGLIAAVLAACSPYLIWYAQDAKMYAPLGALTALILWLNARALREGGTRLWIAAAGATLVSLLVHFFTVFVIAAAGAAFWALWPQTRMRLAPWAIYFGILTLPLAAVAIWQGPSLLSTASLGFPVTTPWEVVARQLFAFAFNSQPAPWLVPPLLAVVALLVFGADRLRGKSGWANRFLLVYLLAPLLLFFAVNARWPLYTERYLIILTPAFFVLVAAGLERVLRADPRWAVAAGVLVFGTSGYQDGMQATTQIKPDLRGAGRYLAAFPAPARILFVMPYGQYPYGYYAQQPFTVVDAPPADQAAPALTQDLAVGPLWLLLLEPEIHDPEGKIADWLEGHARVSHRADFAGVSVREYADDGR